MDIIRYLMGERCVRVSSFGRLGHFTEANAPQGSAGRCLDCGAPKAQCPYDAEKIYLTNPLTGLLHGNSGWPVSVLVHEPTEESVRKALREGPYGRCVYRCDNDVVDHQVVNMEMEDGLCPALLPHRAHHGHHGRAGGRHAFRPDHGSPLRRARRGD